MNIYIRLKQLWMVLVIPIIMGSPCCKWIYWDPEKQRYSGLNQVPLSYYTTTEPNSHYQWTVLYPCQNCEQSTALRNAITTLGTKQSLVKVLIPTTLHEVDEQHFYLADPHKC